jgi:8-oxo-dGTP diphosphatase
MENEIYKEFGHKLRVRVCGLLVLDEKLLLVRHRFPSPKEHLWAPPGGGIHFGESATEALKREFLEETGIPIEVGALCFTYDFYSFPLHAVELFFEVRALRSIEVTLGTDPELEPHQQILDDIAFLDCKSLAAIPSHHLHGSLRGVMHVSELLQRRGYFQEHRTANKDSD